MSKIISISKSANSNYLAKIIKLENVNKHPNADRLQITTVDFQNVIIGPKAKAGDYCVYFPVESQINLDFLSSTNSFRDKDLNKNKEIVGFFENKGRVRAVKLRGEYSMGYVVPLSEIEEFTGKKLKEYVNQEFDTIGETLIVKKYYRQANTSLINKRRGKKPRISRLVDGQVHLHIDTENFRRNVYRINPEDEISISYKVHGCLPYFQRIKMWDGTTKPISKLKIGEKVLGYNHKLNEYVPSTVIKKFKNGKTNKWLVIKKTYNVSVLGSYKNKLICTENHTVLTNNGYIKAKNLKKNDEVYTFNKEYVFSEDTKDFLIGKMLGDAYIDRYNKNWALVFGHKVEHLKYIEYCQSIIKDFSNGKLRKRISGYNTKMIDVRTTQDQSINVLFKNWYNKEGKKIIPIDLKLTPISLAFWYMDDGSLSHSDFQKDRAHFAICGFDNASVKCLEKSLKDYGFNNYTFYNDGRYNRLRLNSADAEKLFKDIRKFIPPILQYKLPEYHRGYFKKHNFGENKRRYVKYPEKIVSITEHNVKEIRNAKIKHDIETETSNFVSGGILIHNSSFWVSNVMVKHPLNIFQQAFRLTPMWYLLYKFNLKTFTENKIKYDIVYGSRRIVKNEYETKNKEHFYGHDLWGEISEDLKGFIPKGYTLYGECVGYTKDGKAIQKDYDYACQQGQYRIFVYRITFTNADGIVNNLSSNQLNEFCNHFGLQTVPFFYIGKAKDVFPELILGCQWHERFIKKLEEKYTEKKCYICNNDVPEEGIVIRKESMFNFEAYKLKSFAFLERETKMLDKDEENIEDNQ